MKLIFHGPNGESKPLRFDLRDRIVDIIPCIAFNLGLDIRKRYILFNKTAGYFSAARYYGELTPTCEYRLCPARED